MNVLLFKQTKPLTLINLWSILSKIKITSIFYATDKTEKKSNTERKKLPMFFLLFLFQVI